MDAARSPLDSRSSAKHEEVRGVAVLISNKMTHITHDLRMTASKVECIMIEIIPSPANRESIFILNVYSSPKDPRQRLKALITKATLLARDSPLIVAGNFNAPYHTWVYPYNTNKGKDQIRDIVCHQPRSYREA
ncbi:hypothetical protein HPB49_008467 [Dermacentor silvarum]|uniref:Uncharacterized protein n=1 Tax=Dermacentor silvarum TaxID=543639 RepID=A0ACB8D405_DERSI|nr:hypothetical protein HPB49_008467 [Dermacentor silvarum]